MQTTTELIDVLNRAEEGDRLTVETDGGEYEGRVRETHYAPPESREEGVVGVDLRTDGEDGELLEIRSTASSSTRKFSRPVVREPSDGETEREILNLRLSEA
jgi:hypothetical protein